MCRIPVLICLVFGFLQPGKLLSQEEAVVDGWLERANSNWRSMVNAPGPTEYVAVSTANGEDDAYSRIYECHFMRRDDDVVYLEHEQLTQPDGKTRSERFTCHGRNSAYFFLLSRTKRDGPWTLRRLALRSGDTDDDYFSHRFNVFVKSVSFGGLLVRDELVSRLFAAPGGRTTAKTTSVTRNGEERLKVDFSFDLPKGAKNFLGMPGRSMAGTVFLDPANGYVPREARIELPVNGSIFHIITDVQPDHPQVRVRQVKTWTSSGRRYTETRVVEDVTFKEKFTAADFRLSAFGLPEPEGFENRWPYKTWGLGVIGVLLVVGGFWLLDRRRRGRIP